MPVITISRGSLSGGSALAKALATKLGCACIDRESLADLAIDRGIQVGQLESVLVKAPASRRKLARERELYLATVTAKLCELALAGDLVYHGHAGHLLLRGVPHVLRVRAVSSTEKRIEAVESRLRLPREQAIEFIDKIDRDRSRWAEYLHGVRWDDPTLYDIVVNLESMPPENAAVALCAMTELPDYQQTPASRRAIAELLLASRARIALGQDEKTSRADVRVRTRGGTVSVHCMPRQASVIEHIPGALAKIEGVENIRCTIAETNILWIEEEFDPRSDTFSDIVAIAEGWDAAVELLRFVARDESDPADAPASGEEWHEGDEDSLEAGGIADTLAELRKINRSGGRRVVHGDANALLHSIDRQVKYSLFVVGGVYKVKPLGAQLRLARELASILSDNFATAVVDTEGIKKQYRAGRGDIATALIRIAIVAAIYLFFFSFQEQILAFTGATDSKSWPLKLLTAISIACFIPLLARLYGSSAARILKMIGIE